LFWRFCKPGTKSDFSKLLLSVAKDQGKVNGIATLASFSANIAPTMPTRPPTVTPIQFMEFSLNPISLFEIRGFVGLASVALGKRKVTSEGREGDRRKLVLQSMTTFFYFYFFFYKKHLFIIYEYSLIFWIHKYPLIYYWISIICLSCLSIIIYKSYKNYLFIFIFKNATSYATFFFCWIMQHSIIILIFFFLNCKYFFIRRNTLKFSL